MFTGGGRQNKKPENAARSPVTENLKLSKNSKMKSPFGFHFIFRSVRWFLRQRGQADRCDNQGRAAQLKRCEGLAEHKRTEDNGDDRYKIDEDGHRKNGDALQGIHIGEVCRCGD